MGLIYTPTTQKQIKSMKKQKDTQQISSKGQ